ncbi:MAG: hypothetical protein JW866_02000 [Ignavibacteriales bacterium]|nr:hypothetical protein [Ignavibacteriales bacterium]
MIRNIFVILILFLIYSCTTTIQESEELTDFPTTYPMTSKTANSLTSNLKMSVPEGWFATEDNEFNRVDLWLVRDDYSASINLIPINLDEKLSFEIKNYDLKFILDISKIMRKNNLANNFNLIGKDEFFKINNRDFVAYQYTDSKGIKARVVIFNYAGSFYELSAISSVDIGKTKVDLKELFTVQNSILSTIR